MRTHTYMCTRVHTYAAFTNGSPAAMPLQRNPDRGGGGLAITCADPIMQVGKLRPGEGWNWDLSLGPKSLTSAVCGTVGQWVIGAQNRGLAEYALCHLRFSSFLC